MSESRILKIQQALSEEGLDGWLFFSFRGSDPIAENVLELDRSRIATRRWAYYVPADGAPRKIVHAIEPHALDGLPGQERVYLP